MRPPRPRRKREQKLVLKRAGAWRRQYGLSDQPFSEVDIEEIRQYGYREFHRRATLAGLSGFPTPFSDALPLEALRDGREHALPGEGRLDSQERVADLDYSSGAWRHRAKGPWISQAELEAQAPKRAEELIRDLEEAGIVVPF